ncbi:hypothetical protein EUZ85_01255 [Hahella sp. KA22]|uniref:hypothetical protein n=1 Tax=Hahella sp. KA22 TaxID=1628392 RepID=UPI000FDE170B|nr:hypothetical protein [Hahella sp. KA22]AZZ95121.1 hypothetical protein ENC22_29545 [Hahella sp. KA22]QAY52766.1 hypothetical protein EUZ85_01255 [Hahella sp. KA22]
MLKNLLAPALTGKGPDYASLTKKECGVGNYWLSFKLPGNMYMPGKQDSPFPAQLNLRADMFDPHSKQTFNRTYVTVGFGWWCYKGFILQGAFGKLCQLSMRVEVNKAENHTVIRASDLDSLESYLIKDFWDFYESEERAGINWKARQRFKGDAFTKGEVPPQYLVHLPEKYDRETINGVDWLAYHLGPEGRAGHRYSYYWAYPLNDSYYLTIGFKMSFEVGDPKELRRERMAEDACRIMSMVELSKGR